MITRKFLPLVLFGLLSTSAVAQGDTPGETIKAHAPMPVILYTESGERVRWVSADLSLAVVRGERRLRREAPWISDSVRQQTEINADGECRIQSENYRERLRPGETYNTSAPEGLPRTIANSESIVFARVTGVAPGFSHLGLKTLYRVEVLRSLRGPATLGTEYFFTLPIGDFHLAGTRHCAYNPDFPAQSPETGDEILVMSRRAPRTDLLSFSGTTGLIVLKNDSVVLPPAYLRIHGPWERDVNQFRQWVTDLTGGSHS